MIKKYKLKDFEFSQNYLFFYDKLEKANYFLNFMIKNKNTDLNDLKMIYMLDNLTHDGGQWNMFVNLIEKYGTEKICWEKLLENPKALDLIKKFKDNKCEDNNYLDFNLMLYMNPSIFQLDKVAMKKQIEPLAKELIEKVLHPSRVIRILNEYKYNIVSDEYWCN